jgi:hypothetical protein
MAFYKIWVPSKQKYVRFKEINSEQYRDILKSVDDDSDFEYNVNYIVQNNCCSKDFLLKEHTIIDRFVILLQLKIHSCGSKLNLTRICDKCDTKTDFSIDLNQLIDELAKGVDRSFEKIFKINDLSVLCDVPSVGNQESQQFDKTDLGKRIDFYLYSFIKSLYIGDKTINLADFDFEQRNEICSNLPFSCINTIKTIYVDEIHRIFSDCMIKETVCSNNKCEDILSIKFDFSSVTDVMKLLFRDSNNVNILSQYANLSMNCHFDYHFYKNICPAELIILDNLVRNSMKKTEQEQNSNKDINMFEQYKLNEIDMVESKSEFE